MLPIVYIVFTTFVILIILLAYRKVLHIMAISTRERSKKFMVAASVVLGWIIYLSIISLTGILKDLNLPPKFPLLIFLPLLIGFLIFYNKGKNSPVIKAIPDSWPVYFQSFRIAVELLLLYTFYAGIIPESATFEGLNFDILMGISAPFVAYFLVRKNASKGVLYLWNLVGIGMILFVGYIIASSMYFPETWGSDVPVVGMKFIEMPFLLLAGFLAPLGIFLHVVSLIQLRQR